MPKNSPRRTSKHAGKNQGVEVEVDPDGSLVFVSFRDVRTGRTVTLSLHKHAASSLRALLARTELESEETFAVVLRGDMQIGEPDEEPRTLSA